VKIRLHRARQALRTLIEQELNPIGVPAPCAGSRSACPHDAPAV